MNERNTNTQKANEIIRLEPREHVRKRPGMYIGGIDKRALHHLVYVLLDDSISEAFAGECNHIWITLREDNVVCIRDNGQGIAVEINEKTGQSTLEIVMTEIGFGSRRRLVNGIVRISGGLNGVGSQVVNALSEWFTVENRRDGYVWTQEYREGKPQTPVTQTRQVSIEELSGISFTFRPDFTIFEPNSFDYTRLQKRCLELSYLVEGLTLTLRDERNEIPIEESFYTTNGLIDMIKTLNHDKTRLHEPITDRCNVTITSQESTPYAVIVDFTLQFTDTMDFTVMSYVNTVETPEGGSHILALRSAVANAINYIIFDDIEDNEVEYSAFEASRGLTAIIHVMHPMPSFVSPTKVKLLVPAELYGAVSEAVFRACNDFLKDDKVANTIIKKCESNRQALKSK